MAIVITLPPPGNAVGPGYTVRLQSSFIGPLPTGTRFVFRISTDAEGDPAGIHQEIPTQGTEIFVLVADRFNSTTPAQGEAIPAGANVHVIAELVDSNQNVLDSGAITTVFDPTSMLWQHINQNTGSGGGGGLTPEQAAQLERTDQNTQEMDVNWQQYVSVTLPSLQDVLNTIITGITTTIGEGASQLVTTIGQRLAVVTQDFFQPYDVSGGETCDPVRFDASFARITGVTVLITQFPPEFRLVTPDGGWTFRDFAVLSFVRGGSLLERHGIHTLSYTVSPLPASIAVWNTGLELDILPGDYHINVDWAPGVCGRVVGEVLP